ncbi:MAG: DMT family protein [Deltaproteobacteria bacterium]|nr:DMT family protein [Deltaproteobacteria bacterium]
MFQSVVFSGGFGLDKGDDSLQNLRAVVGEQRLHDRVILVSWGIAFFEYCLQVPANRIGFGYFTASQLKVTQEVITFLVFGVFSWLYLQQKPTVYDLAAFALIIVAVCVSMFQPVKA